MLNIAMTATHLQDNPAELARLDQQFKTAHAITLENVLEPGLLAKLQSMLVSTAFFPRTLPEIGVQEVGDQDRASSILNLVLGRPGLYRWLEQLTGCGPIGGVEGSVMRLSQGQFLDWHDDMNDPRRALAVTICLADLPYEGGHFQLRRKKSSELSFNHLHTQSGTAVIFEINPTLEHRVTEIQSVQPRTVYAGWFLKATQS